MATIKDVVLKHHKKEDGTYNIKYRFTHNRKTTYINTNYFIGEKQLKKGLSKSYLNQTIETIRDQNNVGIPSIYAGMP